MPESAEVRSATRHDVDDSAYRALAQNQPPYTLAAGYPPFAATVAFSWQDFVVGSGVAIGRHWILTAGHVFATSSADPLIPAEWTLVAGPNVLVDDALRLPVAAIALHPGWQEAVDQDLTDLIQGVDLAVVTLATPLPAEVPVVPPVTDGDEALGALLYWSGYGLFGTGLQGAVAFDGWRRAVANRLDRVLTAIPVQTTPADWPDLVGGHLASDFDHPDGSTNTLDGIPVGAEFDMSYLGDGTSDPTPEPLEGTPAAGDSGGPGLLWHEGAWRVAAITSFGDTSVQPYGDINVGTRVANHAPWIMATMMGSAFPGAVPAARDDFWHFVPWLGWTWAEAFPWILEPDLGWLYVSSPVDPRGWIWLEAAGWVWTGEGVWPSFYEAASGAWLYFLGRENEQRIFVDLTTGAFLYR